MSIKSTNETRVLLDFPISTTLIVSSPYQDGIFPWDYVSFSALALKATARTSI